MTHKQFRPLLAAAAETDDLHKLNFPVRVSPKLDGIRCLCHPTFGVVSRKLKHIPNRVIFDYLSRYPLDGLDGELIAGSETDPHVFNLTTSVVMSRAHEWTANGMPWKYSVFDDFTSPDKPYYARHGHAFDRVSRLRDSGADFIEFLSFMLIENVDQLLAAEDQYLEDGYEGIMIRSLDGRYKLGRSTLRESILVKFKRFADAEAVITGFEELYHNENEAELDERGLTKRSSHKENQVAGDTMGAVCLRGLPGTPFHGVDFKIGTGFTAAQRADMWRDQDRLIGKVVTYRYQPVGVLDKPRFPKFVGIRED